MTSYTDAQRQLAAAFIGSSHFADEQCYIDLGKRLPNRFGAGSRFDASALEDHSRRFRLDIYAFPGQSASQICVNAQSRMTSVPLHSYHRIYIMAGSNVDVYTRKAAEKSAKQILRLYTSMTKYLSPGGKVKVLCPPPRANVRYTVYLNHLHGALLHKLPKSVYNKTHRCKTLFSGGTQLTAAPGVLERHGVHLSADGYIELAKFLTALESKG